MAYNTALLTQIISQTKTAANADVWSPKAIDKIDVGQRYIRGVVLGYILKRAAIA
jgi:hypothetical protein